MPIKKLDCNNRHKCADRIFINSNCHARRSRPLESLFPAEAHRIVINDIASALAAGQRQVSASH
jgi:hypothetical protein